MRDGVQKYTPRCFTCTVTCGDCNVVCMSHEIVVSNHNYYESLFYYVVILLFKYAAIGPLQVSLGDVIVLLCSEGSYSNMWRQVC